MTVISENVLNQCDPEGKSQVDFLFLFAFMLFANLFNADVLYFYANRVIRFLIVVMDK